MDAVSKSNIPKKKLQGEITIPKFIVIFGSVMDENFDLLFSFTKR